MTVWYVDSGAGGSGTGLSAANAHTNIATLMNATSIFAGDEIWIAKRHRENITPGVFGRNLGNAMLGVRRAVHFIGWPTEGDPFWEVRPLEAYSLGWDVHSQGVANNFGEGRYPIVAVSGSFTLRDYNKIYNMMFINSIAGAPWGNLAGTDAGYLDNVWITDTNTSFQGIADTTIYPRIGKLVVGFSPSVGLPIFLDDENGEAKTIRHLVVHSACNFDRAGSCIFNAAGGFRFDRIETHARSVNVTVNSEASIFRAINGQGYPHQPRVGRIFGTVEFPTYPGGAVGGNSPKQVIIENYYGRGPLISQVKGAPRFTRSTSTGAYNYSSNPITLVEVESNNLGSNEGMVYSQVINEVVFVGTSDQYVSFKWELFTVAHSLSMVNAPLHMINLGGMTTPDMRGVGSGNLTASTSNGWGGSSLTVGSAWTFTTTFQLKETGLHRFGLVAGWNPDVGSLATTTRAYTGFFCAVHTPVVLIGA